jgi:F0F1-type ATP synthase membrane subunit b/b'
MNLTQLTLEIHVIIFGCILLFVALIGFLYGRKLVKAKERRILELEDEMLAAHKEILHFAKTNKQLAETLEKAKIPYPVTRIDEEEDEKVRKFPLGKIG